jgi:MoaA/NifB/PqqE/SkfB family radical SAM enzyme
MIFTSVLQSIEINPTELCNLTCSFCPRAHGYPNQNLHMTPETAEIIRSHVDEIDFKEPQRIVITGRGEPTLAKYFEEIVNIFSDKKTYSLHMTTNGKWLFEKYKHLIHKFDHIYYDVYDTKYDVSGSQEKKLNAIKLRKKIERKYKNIKIMFKPDYGGSHYKLTEWGFRMSNRAGSIKHTAHLENEKWKKGGVFAEFYNNVKVQVDETCNIPFRRLFIDWNGDYNLCCHDWSHKLVFGNVREQNILDYLHENESLNHYRKTLLHQYNRKNLTACSECDKVCPINSDEMSMFKTLVELNDAGR